MESSSCTGTLTREYRPASLAICFLLLFPVLLHAIGLAVDVVTRSYGDFSRLDLLFSLGVLLYLSLGVLLSRMRDHALKLVLLVYSTLTPVLAIEFYAYFSGSTDPLPWQPMQRHSTAASTMPGIVGDIEWTINRKGVRGPEFWPSNRNDRILCVGGSTTECLYVTDEKSWPWLLGTRLTNTLGRPILVGNAGQSGHFTLHHIYQLTHYKHADEFGTVIILCGINDVGTLLRDNYQDRAAGVPFQALTSPAGRGAYYRRSWLVGLLYGLHSPAGSNEENVQQDAGGHWYELMRLERQRQLARNTIDSMPAQLGVSLEKYEANVTKIIEICAGRKQRLIFLTQPTMYHEHMSDDLADLVWQHTNNGAHTPKILDELMVTFNARLTEICRKYDVCCIDLASQLPKDSTVFYDDCHFNVNGCDSVAAILCKQLVRDW
jgi:hypothetical protein